MSKLSSEDIKKILKNNEPKSKKILSDEASYNDFMKEVNKKMKSIKTWVVGWDGTRLLS